MRAASTGGRRAWMRNGLVVVEIAMSLVLLIGASLFVRSFLNLQNATVGFDTAPLMTLRFYLPGASYEPAGAKERRVQDIVRRVEGLPGVQAAFASNFVPLGAGGGGGNVIVEGKTVARGEEPGITFIGATPRMRQTLNVALASGRDITESEETTRTPVALVNQTMAKQLWPTEDAIGRRFRLTGDEIPEWFTVVGVVADFRHGQGTNTRPIFPSAYVPYSFAPTLNTGLVVRTAGDPAQLTTAVREQIRLADAALPVFQVRTMEDLRQFSFWQYKLFGWMFSTFGAVALLLAAVGVYGVLSYSVSQRRQEIGVRMALGAGRSDVLRLVIGQGVTLAAIGIGAGVVAALGVTQFIKTLLYNVTASDPLEFRSGGNVSGRRGDCRQLRAGAARHGRGSDHRTAERLSVLARPGYHRGEVQFRLPFLQFVEQPEPSRRPRRLCHRFRSNSCACPERGATSFAFVQTARCASPFRVAGRAAKQRSSSGVTRSGLRASAAEFASSPLLQPGSTGARSCSPASPCASPSRRATLPGAWSTANARS